MLYYADRMPPQELILPGEVGEGMAGYLSERKGRSVQVTIPKMGEKKKLLELVEKNIGHAFMKNELKVEDLQASHRSRSVPGRHRVFRYLAPLRHGHGRVDGAVPCRGAGQEELPAF